MNKLYNHPATSPIPLLLKWNPVITHQFRIDSIDSLIQKITEENTLFAVISDDIQTFYLHNYRALFEVSFIDSRIQNTDNEWLTLDLSLQ